MLCCLYHTIESGMLSPVLGAKPLVKHDNVNDSRNHTISECPTIGNAAEEEIVQRLTIPEAATRWARDVVNESWIEVHPLVTIVPEASFPLKMWPTHRYIAASRELLQEFGRKSTAASRQAGQL